MKRSVGNCDAVFPWNQKKSIIALQSVGNTQSATGCLTRWGWRTDLMIVFLSSHPAGLLFSQDSEAHRKRDHATVACFGSLRGSASWAWMNEFTNRSSPQ